MQIDDETLMALADGELDGAEAARVSAAIADDPQAQARLRRFSETRARLRALSKAPAGQTDDDDLIARIRAASIAASIPAPVSAAPPPAPAVAANRNRAPWTAIAAGLMAVAMGLGWWQMTAGDTLAPAEIAALDSLPSGQAATLEDGNGLTMIASYRTAEGALCREYETEGTARLTVSVACRGSDGWQRQFASVMTATDDYVPASGDITALDDWLAQTGAGEPLTLEDEAAALAE
ncbi:hypothetical protein [uncultured Paracoccus sp.]|uniref:anti-sigma factor family protein n=1 Tax=uncultured Paracoccus sp. TaxID=189685 RepID=UPI0025E4055B|nr:hypothetical protein [uncultured Paracoccus sp.]